MKENKLTLRQWFNKESVAGSICTLPFAVGFLCFTLVPICMSLYYSLTDYNILSQPKFIGLANYIEMFTADKTYIKSLFVTIFYTFISVPMRLVFALAVAVILVRNTRMTPIYRAVYYLPSIIGGSVAVSILWKRIFATDGVINALLAAVGSDTQFAWLGNTKTAIWTLILLAVWQFGSSMLIFLSALKQIPNSLYESARVDGASRPYIFWKITLPMLTPTIFFNLIMQMISGFLAFSQCYIITQGKPMNSTLFYTVYMYQQSFEFYRMGYGAAMAWVMLFIVGTVTVILFKTKKKWVFSEGE